MVSYLKKAWFLPSFFCCVILHNFLTYQLCRISKSGTSFSRDYKSREKDVADFSREMIYFSGAQVHALRSCTEIRNNGTYR